MAPSISSVRRFLIAAVQVFALSTLGVLPGFAADGPTPPELIGFTPPNENAVVDLFTGDFRYSVPLMEVPGPHGGYPITLSYSSGISPEQEASWVGLGWSLNPGSIVRQMRGIPDDFAGGAEDQLETRQDVEPSTIYGLGLDANFEIFGLDTSKGLGLSAGFKGYFNNYRGLGYTRSVGLSGQVSAGGTTASVGLNLSLDSQQGLKASPSVSLRDVFRFSADIGEFHGLSTFSVSAFTISPQARYLKGSFDAMSFLGYAKPTSIPATGHEMDGENINLSFKFGVDIQGFFVNFRPYGFFNRERLKNKHFTTEAFGFLHLHEALAGHERAALDFNREKDGAIYDRSPNLAVPVLTHDLFTASGRDLTGTFRAYRNDIPVVFDPKQESSLTGGALGVEVGPGTIVKVGVNGAINRSSSVIGAWDGGDGGALLSWLKTAFIGDPSGAAERTYFKFIGEPSSSGAVVVGGGTAPLAVPLKAFPLGSLLRAQGAPEFYAAGARLETNHQAVSVGAPANASRVPRATFVQAITQKELKEQGAGFYDFPAAQTHKYRQDNHIAGFRITTQDGSRYIYGIAVYNTVHEEHEFSVARDDRTAASYCTLVTPTKGGTASAGAAFGHQVDGSEKLLQVKSIPPYATSYLLTAELGPDYVDADTTPGPSDGDYGRWVRFDYVPETELFKWRLPYSGARFVRGPDNGVFVSGQERRSDKGFVSYGKRESWYLSSIETATHKALFCGSTDTRKDAISATSSSQTSTPASGLFMRPRQLDRVMLFSKEALGSCSGSGLDAKSLVTAELVYDQSLMVGAPNHDPAEDSGKLTLQEVYFTHGTNNRGKLSPYAFDYGEGDSEKNPRYAEAGRDRWDVYRDLTKPITCQSIAPPVDPTLDLESPYTAQSEPKLDKWSAAWTLRKVVDPSGRAVMVDFESDDYAYVQDQPATRMFPIVSVNNGFTDSTEGRKIAPVKGSQPRVYFPLEAPVTSASEVASKYLDSNRQVYFKIRVALKNDALWQTVTGYANAVDAGTASGQNNEPLGWIALEPVQGYHPLAMAAWQYLRLQQPELISDSSINGDPNAKPFVEALKVLTAVDFLEEILTMASGIYPTWMNDGWGQNVDLAHSWIRLREPDGIKKGGGARVKRVAFSDAWSESTATLERSLETGYVYDYRLPDGRSSGVAAYEPMLGGDENPLRRAKPFTDDLPLSSSYNLFAETPLGESHYPAPVVGYSRVVRRSLAAEADRQAKLAATPKMRPSSAGPVVHEFYTARDFPVRAEETPIDKQRNPQPHIIPIPFLGMITLNSLTASQGYSVVLNDMHGKQRRVTTYEYTPEWDDVAKDYKMFEEPVEETEFIYATTGGYGGASGKLSNAVTVLTADAARATETLGEQSEFVVDLRLNRTESWDAGIDFNLDVIFAIAPVPFTVPIPNFGYSLSETKTVVTSRVVHRAGIVTSVRTRQGSARFEARHLAFDPLTGRALLTQSDNTYGDPVFTYDTLGRWSYPRMGAAYDDVGLTLSLAGATIKDTRTVLLPALSLAVCSDDPATRTAPCLPVGSELLAQAGATGVRLTLTGTQTDGSILLAADRDVGAQLSATAVAVRSGDRNLLTASTGSIRALKDPTDPTGRVERLCVPSLLAAAAVEKPVALTDIHGVLEATRATYRDDWPSADDDVRFTGTPAQIAIAGQVFGLRNDFDRGVRGIFRPWKQFVYVDDRGQSSPVDLRNDGTYVLVAFDRDGSFPSSCGVKWRFRREFTRYSPSGFETEERNPLGVPSASLYGLRGSAPIAVASNAVQDEIGFEGFESFAPDTSVDVEQTGETNITFSTRTFSPPEGSQDVVSVSATKAHTGAQSLRVLADSQFRQTELLLVPGRYLVSAWISRDATDVPTFRRASPSDAPIGLQVDTWDATWQGLSSPEPFEPAGPVIDGWQRIEGMFEMPPGANRISMTFMNGSEAIGTPAYFDDVRVLPEAASLESFVYDAKTLRISAKLDENNFATLYGYAPDGRRELVVRETMRGFLTEKESRLHVRERP